MIGPRKTTHKNDEQTKNPIKNGNGLGNMLSYGRTDIYFTGNPEINILDKKYKKFENFGSDYSEYRHESFSNFVYSYNIIRNCDIIKDITIKFQTSAKDPVYKLLDYVQIIIGDYKFTYYSDYILFNDTINNNVSQLNYLDIPLVFDIPLISMENVGITKLLIKTTKLFNDICTDNPTIICKNIYLDTPRKRQMALNPHTNMFKEINKFSFVKNTNDKQLSCKIEVQFQYVMSYLIVIKNFTTILKFDNVEISRDCGTFNSDDIFIGQYTAKKLFKLDKFPDGMYFYTYSLNPLDYQPSGICNYMNNLQFNFTFSHDCALDIDIYVINYNIVNFGYGHIGTAYNLINQLTTTAQQQ
jgi:hypothetical protein